MRRSSLHILSHTRVHLTSPSTSSRSVPLAGAAPSPSSGASTSHAYGLSRSRTSRVISSQGDGLLAFLRGRFRPAPAPAPAPETSPSSSSSGGRNARPETCTVSSAVDAFLSPARSVLASRSRTRSAVSSFLSAVLLRPAVEVEAAEGAAVVFVAVRAALVCPARPGTSPFTSSATALRPLFRAPGAASTSTSRSFPLPFLSLTPSFSLAFPFPFAPGLVRMSAHRSSSAAGGLHCGSAPLVERPNGSRSASPSSTSSGRKRLDLPGSAARAFPFPLMPTPAGGAWYAGEEEGKPAPAACSGTGKPRGDDDAAA
ncbi:hypothetical protein DMC30DRAFT_402206 [Rhodotorula diobovata]|uniref:Uncharacterized protein n=1 Tax=Rhodotorula diobovata TaxID=5288 RepID=A0A5C5FPL2_9BASI|nr:hypothetical protein DMC30DRAFT_402206 [Rhodotorula diobovata]